MHKVMNFSTKLATVDIENDLLLNKTEKEIKILREMLHDLMRITQTILPMRKQTLEFLCSQNMN